MRALTFLVLGAAIAVAGIATYEAIAQPPPSIHRPGSYYFGDCSSGSPHDDHIGYAYECGIVQGFPEGNYGPAQLVSREQMATYAVRTLALACAGAELLVDYDYTGGALYGAEAYSNGWITWEEYQILGNGYQWLVDMLWAQIEPMGYPNPYDQGSSAVFQIMREIRERRGSGGELTAQEEAYPR